MVANLAGVGKLLAVLERGVGWKSRLEWPNVWPVAIRAFGKNFLVEDHRISADQDRLFVTHVTGNFGMAPLKRKVCPRVVIEG